MKYIFQPIFFVLIFLAILVVGAFKMLWITAWHFRKPSLREAYTLGDGEYLFDDWSWKEFFRDMFIYRESFWR